MPLEAATFIAGLVATNPPGTDLKSQGDDHLRLIKSVLQNTFPDASSSFAFPKASHKTANYNVLATDDNTLFSADATAGTVNFNLPAIGSVDSGFQIGFVSAVDVSNLVTITPAAGTIDGFAVISLGYRDSVYIWSDGSNWHCFLIQYEAGYKIPEVTVASAATADISATAAARVIISGTTTITSFGTRPNRLRYVRFLDVLILTHNATSLILPAGSNITTAAGDSLIAFSDSSGNWRVVSYTRASITPLSISSVADIQGNNGTGIPSTNNLWSAAAEVFTLTDAANIASDMEEADNFTVTLGANRTLSAPSNPKIGQTGYYEIVQDGTGNRTLAFNSAFKFQNGGDPILTTTAGAKDYIFYKVRDTVGPILLCSFMRNMS